MDKATKTKAWKELTKPFAKSVIKKSPKGFGDFVPHHIYTRRLVDSGLLKSFDTVEVIRGAEGHVISARCTLVVDSPEGEKTVTSCGDVEPSAINMFKNGKKSEGELIKDAESDALKRCCMRLGIGLHMWEQDMSEEEYSASISVDNNPKPKPEVKVEKKPPAKISKEEQEKMEETVEEMVSDKSSNVKKELNLALKQFIANDEERSKVMNEIYKKVVDEQNFPTSLNDWSDDQKDSFIDIVEIKVKAKEKLEETKELVEETFGEVKDNTRNCPECGKPDFIEDNRQKKKDGTPEDPKKFASIPSWSCNNYPAGGKHGCGWVAWGDTDCPTEWL